MENEIKVGEYIRTKFGDIKKITEGFEFIIERHNNSANKIVKHSPNLIDLIEVGDYVNGLIIDKVENDRNPKLIWHLSAYGDEDIEFRNEDIGTVVTKEMMESISYKVTKM